MKKVLVSLTLLLGMVVTVVSGAVAPSVASAKPLWMSTGSCSVQPVSVSDNAKTANCTIAPDNTELLSRAEFAASNIANNEYVRTTGCAPKTPKRTTTCSPDMLGPWTVKVNVSVTSITIQMTGLPNQGAPWTASYSGPGVPFFETLPLPTHQKTLVQSRAAFYQWESDIEGLFSLTGSPGVIGTDGQDYILTTSGGGHTTTVTAQRAT